MAFSSNNKQSFSEINVTPLVDVMLVLLIIFMVTAPMMQQGIKVRTGDYIIADYSGVVVIPEEEAQEIATT